ncbi:IclR family transcriptional regulator [Streptomyces globisporus]|uniref:IclR family transcriptional regulator n=1 Tax=Streptomyces TaxID=1883 RepID=UPI001FADF018|nr:MULTISPECIES: IclR family transcriptional regulator [unclassified Streptomyces]MDX3605698.1 IclR family transcriptional regulator [Streptomyces sp. FL06-04B]MDX3736211.1 IclR family transcriptional regulator [Streptomyces sp. ID01-15D]
MGAEQGTGINQSVERAAAVLAAFHDGQLLRVADVAARSGLGQSTTSRMLATLEALEFVEREDSGLYRLGTGLITIAGSALNQHPVYRASRPHAQEAAAVLGLGVNVSILHRGTVFYLANYEGAIAPKSMTLAGQRNALHATGMGKCLLVGTTPEERRELLPELPAFTAHTIDSHDALDTEVDRTAGRGYATEVEELALGRACVAAPVRDAGGQVVAAISISGSLSAIDLRTREDELAGRVIETADEISTALGYTGPAVHPHRSAPATPRSTTGTV